MIVVVKKYEKYEESDSESQSIPRSDDIKHGKNSQSNFSEYGTLLFVRLTKLNLFPA